MFTLNTTRIHSAILAIIFGLAVSLVDVGQTRGQDRTGFSPRTLADFNVEGIKLGSAFDAFQKSYSKAELLADQSNDKLKVKCYELKQLPKADTARFYFVDGILYQIELTYDAKRIAAQGGMPAVIRRLVADFGPPDHAGESRRTWQQVVSSRRADFFLRGQSGLLLVTDTGLTPVVDQRTRQEEAPIVEKESASDRAGF